MNYIKDVLARIAGRIGCLLLFLLLIWAVSWLGDGRRSESPRAPTARPFPTTKIYPTLTPDGEPSDNLPAWSVQAEATRDACTPWSEVQKGDIGKQLCVRGKVVGVTGNVADAYALRVYFSKKPQTLYLYDNKYYYPDLDTGDYVCSTGKIGVTEDGTLFMRVVNGIDLCKQ